MAEGLFICDRCAFEYPRSRRRKEWSGLIVCPECRDPRPRDMTPPKAFPEGVPFKDARPEPTPWFVEDGEITEDAL